MPTLPPTAPRIVQCPKCRSILQEPPPGNPFYQCGNCSTTLQAKHATPRDLEAASRRISAEQQRKNSLYSDSSSGEIGSDIVAEEYALTGTGNDSPMYNKRQETVRENGRRGRDVREGETKPQQQQFPSQDAGMVLSESFLQSLRNQEQEMKQRVLDLSGAQYISSRAAQQQEIVSSTEQLRPASPDQQSSYGMSVVHVHQRTEVRSSRTDVTSSGEFNTMSSVGGQLYGIETIPNASAEARTTNGHNFVPGEAHQQEQLQVSHVQQRNYPDFTLESVQDTTHNHHGYLRGLSSSDEPSANNNAHALSPPITVVQKNIGASRRKLKWQVRESDSGEEATSSGADDDGSSQDDVKSTVSVKETISVNYILERNWRTVHSRGSSFNEDGGPLDDQQGVAGLGQQQQRVRTHSGDSDRPFDMYENSGAHALDYEPSDTSSTTVEDVEINGGAGSGRFSGEMVPPAIEQAVSRPMSRRNFPRSNTSSGNRNVLSEESSSYGSPVEMVMSPDHRLDNARMINAAARRHSWDERVSRMGNVVGVPGHTGPLRESPLSVRVKSSSQDYGSGHQADYLQRATSDPRGYGNARGRQLLTSTSLYDNYNRQPNPFPGRPLQHQQPWVNRYVPPSQSLHQPWSPNSASHRPYVPEQSPLHPLHSRLSSSVRQIQTGQLPPKQGLYPPLPPPGALPHVLCQHCGLLLAVPDNLPPHKNNMQKLRCGSCKKISIFSVPRAEGAQVFSSSRSDSLQNKTAVLLATSPDSQAEFTSTYRPVSNSLGAVEKQRSVRRYSVSDLAARKQEVQQAEAQEPLVRKHSLGNEDLKEIDQELVERALALSERLSERAENLLINSNLSAGTQDAASTSSEAESPSSPYPVRYNNISQNVNAGYKVPALEEKLSSEGMLSDSDSDSMQRTQSVTSSPRLNHINAMSPPSLPSYSPRQDATGSGRAPGDGMTNEQGHEARGLNKALNRIFIFRKSKQTGAAHYRRKVVVNGVPIPDHLVKKAEEQAGPIHPGTYWYDGQAGFWGAAGGQCLGIIPPFIEEFNYPLTRDCAAGRTGIFVNGRELHYADKEKLCRRGLPDTPMMSYHIEIDGRVVEDATGSELRSLGRLAPSLEKSGRGTGMREPPNISERS